MQLARRGVLFLARRGEVEAARVAGQVIYQCCRDGQRFGVAGERCSQFFERMLGWLDEVELPTRAAIGRLGDEVLFVIGLQRGDETRAHERRLAAA